MVCNLPEIFLFTRQTQYIPSEHL